MRVAAQALFFWQKKKKKTEFEGGILRIFGRKY
jgi:hypothetical protein